MTDSNKKQGLFYGDNVEDYDLGKNDQDQGNIGKKGGRSSGQVQPDETAGEKRDQDNQNKDYE